MSSGELRTVVLCALSKASDVLPDGSPFAENIRAARRQVDNIIDHRGVTFANERTKDGILTILDQALDQYEGNGLVFVGSELHEIRERLADTPIATL